MRFFSMLMAVAKSSNLVRRATLFDSCGERCGVDARHHKRDSSAESGLISHTILH